MVKLNITKRMTGKLTGIQSINTDPFSNPFCMAMSSSNSTICSMCYSQQMLKAYRRGCLRPWKENGELLSSSILPVDALPNINQSIFRLSAHGEIINETMYLNYLNIVAKNPSTTFTLWTKRKDIVSSIGKRGNKNLILIYSSPQIDVRVEKPEHFDKLFTVYTPAVAQKNKVNINCGSKRCIECMLCYTHNRTTYINEIVKSQQHIWKHMKEGN